MSQVTVIPLVHGHAPQPSPWEAFRCRRCDEPVSLHGTAVRRVLGRVQDWWLG